ncbi:MAG: serine hydroxymethyltransferase [Patescibacteria group bacterium]|nr:serine hydroxymethyltransferase [Patescibacteria group bacterium]
MRDRKIKKLIKREQTRQNKTLNLIASENFVSGDILNALGSVFVNKYAEGYPGARYYSGTEVADELEELVQARALRLFQLSSKKWNVNVQPYSGSPANLAILLALVPRGNLPAGRQGKIMGMRLDMGGHLTHGYKASVTGKLWRQIPYVLDPKTELLDYDEILKLAKKEKPKLIIAGGSAYSKVIDFKKFREIADAVEAILLVDMSHFAGLVTGGAYPSPFPHAHVVMTTTHKTLRGPRAALIFSKKELSKNIDRMVFPGIQGGPHMNAIAAVGVALYEASLPSFKKYAKQVVKNTYILAEELKKLGWRIISGGTNTHLFNVDTFKNSISGNEAADLLEKAGIVVNIEAIPYDLRPPKDPSGIRLGAAALTTRGMKEKEMRLIAQIIDKILRKQIKEVKEVIQKLCAQFPIGE